MSDKFDMEDMVKLQNIQIKDSVDTWEDAIRVSLRPLVDRGYVEPRYVENVIADIKNVGPYVVLTDDIALIHARPEEGAIKTQMGLTLLRNPVRFEGSDSDVTLLFALAAQDSTSHVDAIRVLANFCMDESKVEQLKSCSTPEEIFNLLMAESEASN
jgi:mannitol/fructose-specific phosphotransferase system IIA component (Ntr-type)